MSVLLPTLASYCATLPQEFAQIPDARKENLQQIADFIGKQRADKKVVQLTFICTHNSRRSHFGQVWAKVAATYYQFADADVQTFSGGTEVTACNPRTIASMQRAGVNIETPANTANPHYKAVIGAQVQPLLLFSKRYDDEHNPQSDFGAVLVCSSADGACPIVRGAAKRILHSYEDPKRGDDKPDEAEIYDQTCRQIAREMFYTFSLVKK